MRRRVLVAVFVAAGAFRLLASAQTLPAFETPTGETTPRLQRLVTWLSAIERHEIGTPDAYARLLRPLSYADLYDVFLHVRSVLKLVRDPDATTFFRPAPDGRRPPTPIVYSGEELRTLRALARQIGAHADSNHVLKRGALLHGDVAMLLPAEVESAKADRPRNRPSTYFFADGRGLGFVDPGGHLDIARLFLAEVTPRPAKDDVVRLWYQATITFQHAQQYMDLKHVEQALLTLPDDPAILFLAGCMHENLAAPRMQIPIGSGPGFVASERGELRQAETLLKRALALNPMLSEARLHLGWVLARLERHADAVVELRRADEGLDDPLLDYYAALFLGREAQSLGRFDEARAAYERAAALFPGAQSPRLSLQHLADRRGDPVAPVAMERVIRIADEVERVDPWSFYHVSHVLDVEMVMAGMHQAFAAEDHR